MSSWLAGLAQVPALHFHRPLWLWALLLLPLLWLAWRRRRRQGWRDAVDAHLLPHLLEPARGRAGLRLAGASVGLLLAVLALAGPGWRQEPRPQWETRAPLVIALDLSSAIQTPDLAPTRLAQARAKVATLLRERKGGEVGLVAWAEDAYTVAPLTTDAGNIALFLDALGPEVMPVDGRRPERAITHAATLLHQAGFERGDILLVTGQADAASTGIAAGVAAQGYRVSVLGLGTPAGGMYRDRAGAMQPARREDATLRALAAAGQGRYATLAIDDRDLHALGVLDPSAEGAAGREAGPRVWLDQGYWLLLPVLVLAALAFRRGAGVLAALPLAVMLSWPSPAQAGETAGGGWWRRPDQQAQARIAAGVDAYRSGDFAAAGQAFSEAGARGAEAAYNLGNALARQGRYDEAITAYDRALAQAPGMEDAIANRRVVDEARRRQPPKGGQGQGGKGQDGQNPPRGEGGASPQDGQGGGADGRASPQRPAEPPPQQGDGTQATPPPQAEDAQARARQEQADREQRQRMQQALQDGRQQGGQPDPAGPAAGDAHAREQRQAREAWLRRVPDDPGGLLRAKFRLEYERRQQEGR
ncbi:VWA domain-containing protein [Pseudoxanthomonas sp. 10H]|uniref:VWA domain-containing protein n=1 Tax=Pseudoxanthomonas sp. 10H TaxID=3242729 RepID=UPI003557BA72